MNEKAGKNREKENFNLTESGETSKNFKDDGSSENDPEKGGSV